jgi:uncharacterized protein YuzB (UPF0349 family)
MSEQFLIVCVSSWHLLDVFEMFTMQNPNGHNCQDTFRQNARNFQRPEGKDGFYNFAQNNVAFVHEAAEKMNDRHNIIAAKNKCCITHRGKFPNDNDIFAYVDCSILKDDATAELFQNSEAGFAIDIFGMTVPPSKSTEATSSSSFLQDTQDPDLSKREKKASVTFVTFWDSRFQLMNALFL